MPRASCTLELWNHYLHVLNHMTMVKNTLERMSLWASLYPRLVWGFPPSSAAWWAKASDFAQSATWDCFLQFPPCEPIMLPNLPAGEPFKFSKAMDKGFFDSRFMFCPKNMLQANISSLSSSVQDHFCVGGFSAFRHKVCFHISLSPFSWGHFLLLPPSSLPQSSQRPSAHRQTWPMSQSKWLSGQKLFHWKIINCNCNLLGLKCLMFSRRVPLSAFLSAKQQVPPFKSSLLDASQIVHKLWEQLPVWPPLTWSRRHPSSGQPHGRGEGRREPTRLHNPSRTNLCSSLQCMSPG